MWEFREELGTNWIMGQKARKLSWVTPNSDLGACGDEIHSTELGFWGGTEPWICWNGDTSAIPAGWPVHH